MSDDRFTRDPNEANANDRRAPYIDRRAAGQVRPASRQPDRRGPPTPEEIAAFIHSQYPETAKPKKRLERPEGWDEAPKAETDPAEDFER